MTHRKLNLSGGSSAILLPSGPTPELRVATGRFDLWADQRRFMKSGVSLTDKKADEKRHQMLRRKAVENQSIVKDPLAVVTKGVQTICDRL